MNLNELVERCAGTEKKQQVAFLGNILLKVMIDKCGRDDKLPDGNAVPAVLENMPVLNVEYVRENPIIAEKLLDEFYSVVSQLLLEDDSFDILNLRSAAGKCMVAVIKKRDEIQNEAKNVGNL